MEDTQPAETPSDATCTMKVVTYDLSAQSDPSLTHSRSGRIPSGQGCRLSASTVIELGSTAYHAQANPECHVQLTHSPEWQVLTSFDATTSSITAQYMQTKCDEYVRKDDVFNKAFLESILIATAETNLSDEVIQLLRSWECQTVFLLTLNIPNGPYFYSCRGIFRAWRLYPDYQEAFVLSTIPSQDDPNIYLSLNASAYSSTTLCVAVPSRLYFTQTSEKPLAGLRIALKDLFHVKGVYTGCGNRAYRQLYPQSSVTSYAVQRAIDRGAIVVGKVKTVEFGGSQEVIGDWSDYSYAFNSRGDGYFVCTGSSTGSASAMAAYDWLDVTLGTDAGGSIRDPAVVHGLYGLRPSHDGSIERDASVPCPIFQRSGYFGRSTESMLHFGRNWLERNSKVTQSFRPEKMLFPVEYKSDNAEVQRMVEEFVVKLCAFLEIEALRVSIENQWTATKPIDISENFFDYFHTTFMDVLANEYWLHAANFREDYFHAYGSAPYVSRPTQWLWNSGKSTTKNQKHEALTQVQQHNSWFTQNVLQEGTIMVVPRYDTRYRDEYLCPPEDRDYNGFDSNLHASLAGLPNIIVPIGQCKFNSKISGKQEYFPVSASITGPKGTDVGLVHLIHDFLSTQDDIPNSVLTGKLAFPVKD